MSFSAYSFTHFLNSPESKFNRKMIKSRNRFLFLVVDWLYMPKTPYGISYAILTYRADFGSL